jgi:hypothetical protein
MEPSEAPDLVGRTSARLLAAGVDRRARLDALRLLAILDASTDGAGRVRRPLDDLAGEFELSPLTVIQSLDHLEQAGAVQRDGAAVVILGDGSDLGGLQLADFLEDVQASFDGAPHASRARLRRPTLVRFGAAVLAGATAVAILTFAPSPSPTVIEPLAAGSSTTIAAEESTTTVFDLPVPTTAVRRDPVPGTETTEATAPVDTSVVAATACPTASPVAQVIDDVVRITNPSDEDLQVTELAIGGVVLTTPFVVPAGGIAERPVIASITDEGPVIQAWHWLDPAVARTCPE